MSTVTENPNYIIRGTLLSKLIAVGRYTSIPSHGDADSGQLRTTGNGTSLENQGVTLLERSLKIGAAGELHVSAFIIPI